MVVHRQSLRPNMEAEIEVRHFWHMGIVKSDGSIVPRRILQRQMGKTYRASFTGDNGKVVERDDGTICIYSESSVNAEDCTFSIGITGCAFRYAASLPDPPQPSDEVLREAFAAGVAKGLEGKEPS